MADLLARLQAALADRYTIERELGRGGMATVYLARDRKHGRPVAIKVLRPEIAAALGPERFLREIELAARLTHPHILPLHDSGAADGFLYYVMPFVEGESLRGRLDREKQLPVDEALLIVREVADALGYAHSHDVVHRDIKPENILFEAGHAVVSDFGIARAITAAGGGRVTETGIALGTPAYMSPEQASGETQFDGRSDVYSLGCVLYEMLAGEPPYTGASAHAIIAKRLSEPVPRVSVLRETVTAGLESTMRKALAKLPADRFATAAQFAEALTGEPPIRRAFAAAGGGRPGAPQKALIRRELSRLIGYSRLSMKNDISYLSFKTSDEIVNAVNEIARRIPRDSDEVFFVNQGGGEIVILCEGDKEKLLERVRYQAVDYRPRVAVLRIQESHEQEVAPGIEVPGLYAYFINQLADNGINILDIVSTRSQLTVVVAEEDSWRISSRLTIDAGVRWASEYLYGSNGLAQSFLNEWQPRFGVSYQLGRPGTQRVFGSWGIYYQQQPLDFASGFYVPFPELLTYYSSDPQLATTKPDSARNISTYPSQYPNIPGLRVEHHREVALGYERLVATSWRLTARVMRRDLLSAFGNGLDTADARFYVVGVPGEGALSFLPRFRRSYTALELSAEWADEHGNEARFSYVLSRTYGNYTGFYASDYGFAFPGGLGGLQIAEDKKNSTGLLPNDRTHVLKLLGSHRLPLGVTLGTFLTWQSGTPLNEFGTNPTYIRQTFLVPRGSVGRTPAIWDLNLRLAYPLRDAGARATLDWLHIGSPRRPVWLEQVHYVSEDVNGKPINVNPTYGQVRSYQPPAQARLGVEFTF